MKRVCGILIVSMLSAVPGGCLNYTEPVAVPAAPLTPAERDFDAVWQGSLEVLRAYRFEIDRRDRRAGVITTEPMLARHGLEFWRPDAVNLFDLLEGTLQTVMRRAEVRIVPRADAPGRYEPLVTIEVTRPDRHGLEIVAAGEAYDKFLDTYDSGGSYYERYRERKKLKRAVAHALVSEGEASAAETAEASGYALDPPEALGRQETLAHRLASEIRAAAAGRLGRKP